MAKTNTLDDTQIRVNGIKALNEALGPAAALRFLTMLKRDATDYVDISRQLYQGQTINGIFSRARRQWKK